MGYLIGLLVSGGVSGAIFSILAIGLVLSYSASGVFNFGLGAGAFSCALLYFQLNSGLGLPSWAAAVIVVFGFAPLAGLVWDRLVFRRVANAGDSVKLVATIGVLVVMPAVVILVTDILRESFHVGFANTASVLQTPGIGPNPPIQWHVMKGVAITSDQVITLGVAFLLFVALSMLLRYTRLGLKMRTAVDRPHLAELRGTNTDGISAITWIVSFMLAGAAGVLAGPIPGFGLSADNYTVALFVAATVAVFARLRSVPIAFIGGLLIGAATNLSTGYLNSSYLGSVGAWIQNLPGLQASLPYWALLIGLAIMAIERGRRAGVVADGAPPPDYLSDLSTWRRRIPWIICTAAFFIYAMSPINPIWRSTVELALAMAVVFLSYTIVTGIGGMVSLAQPAFVTAAAIVTGYLVNAQGFSFIPAAIVGALVAMILGIVVALPALRLGGIPLALSSLALALLGYTVLFQIPSLVNGSVGWTINRPKIGFIDLGNERVLVVCLFVIMLVGVWMVTNLQRSASGRAMTAVRSSEAAASASAISSTVTKLTLFAIAALFAGVGGVLLVLASGAIQGQQYPPNPLAFLWLVIVVVWGVRRPAGAVVAGIVSVFFPAILTSGIHIGSFGWNGTTQTLIPEILFGAAAIGLAKNPDGIFSQLAERRHRRRKARALAPQNGRGSADTEGGSLAPVASDYPIVQVSASPLNGVAAHPEPILELRGLRAGYGDVEVLNGIDLAVPTGSIVALLGPNGAGKTTLCSTIGGLVRPTAGAIRFDGADITDCSAHDRVNRGLVIVPESRGIFPSVSVEENVALWLPDRSAQEQVYERFPHLARRRRLPAGNLSGGEQQMLSIGPLLVRPPKLLVIDEPTLGIAHLVAVEIMNKLRELASGGTTVILVEERACDVMTIAEWVGPLYRGQMHWFTEKSNVNDELLASAYMGGALLPQEPTGVPQP